MRAALITLMLLTAAPARADDEPEYEGKPLEYWVQRFRKAETIEQRYEAATAIKAFGADAAPAVPALAKMLADRSAQFREEVIAILGALGPVAKDARPALLKLFRDNPGCISVSKIDAFIALHPAHRDAVPFLVPLLDAGSDSVCSALCGMGPEARDAIPAIRRHVLKQLADKEKDKRKFVYYLDGLYNLGPDVVPLLVEMLDAHGGCGRTEALDGLYKLAPKAKEAAPALVKLLKDDDPDVRLRAAEVLWKVEKNPTAVTVLADLLRADPHEIPPVGYASRTWSLPAQQAARALGEMGPDARAALSRLRETVAVGLTVWLLTSDCDPPYRPSLRFVGFRDQSRTPADESDTGNVWLNAEARISAGRAAAEAIGKIEAEPKK
jgi:hypothetical protein